MGWVQGTQDWTLGGEAPSSDGDSHARHDPVAMMQPRPKPAPVMSGIGLDDIVAKAQRENLAFPVTVSPPGAPGLFDATGPMDWAVRSDAQNRPMRMTEIGRAHVRTQVTTAHLVCRLLLEKKNKTNLQHSSQTIPRKID